MAKKEQKPAERKPAEWNLEKFLEKELRRVFKKTPMFREAKARAKEEFFEKSKHGKPLRRVRYKCAQCGRKFLDRKGSRDIAVDHRDPVVDPKVGFVNVSTWIERLFCSVDNLWVLCNYPKLRDGVKSCHKIKTAEENAERKKHKG